MWFIARNIFATAAARPTSEGLPLRQVFVSPIKDVPASIAEAFGRKPCFSGLLRPHGASHGLSYRVVENASV